MKVSILCANGHYFEHIGFIWINSSFGFQNLKYRIDFKSISSICQNSKFAEVLLQRAEIRINPQRPGCLKHVCAITP